MTPETDERHSPSGSTRDYCRAGLAALDDQPLSARAQSLFDDACRNAGGPPAWRRRKIAEARDLLAMGELASRRLRVDWLSLGDGLKAVLQLLTPVAVRAAADQEVEIVRGAVLGLSYDQPVMLEPQPGYVFFCVFEPQLVWHAQVSRFPVQRLCLGQALPAGIRVKELILMAYNALSMQAFQIDDADPAGVLNVDAAQWWQRNAARIPLSRVPFLGDPALDGEDLA